MKSTAVLAFAALLAGTADLHAAVPAGAQPRNYAANPERHVINIQREAATDRDKTMIEAAEAAMPDTGVWWNVENGQEVRVMGLKTPYALTGEALKYYIEKMEEYRTMAWPARFGEPSSRLDYTATVAGHDTFSLDGKEYRNVHVVTLRMAFQTAFTGASTGGTRFRKQRTVVLDEAGEVLAISGDKAENFRMWMM